MDTLSQGHHQHSRTQGAGDMTDRTPLRHDLASGVLNRKDYAIGIALLLCVVLLWTASNFITQDLFEDGFAKPFFVTYMNTSAFTLYLLPFAVKKVLQRRWGTGTESIRLLAGYQPLSMDDDAPGAPVSKPHSTSLPPLTPKETAHLAAVFCIFWFIANWTVNASLDFTSVASATILSSMSGFFTLGIGRLFRVERLSWLKVTTVLVSFLGVILVSWSDHGKQTSLPDPSQPPTNPGPKNPILGDALALISAVFYAIYVILLKVRIKSESRIDMQLFFGFVGLFNILLCWPVGLVLHLTGMEVFELPSSSRLWAGVLINMAITWSSDYLYVLSMLKTTPLVVTVGLSLTIPFAVLGDFLKGRGSEIQVVLGALLVLISFIALGIAGEREEGEQVPQIPVGGVEHDDHRRL
ncbi:vacuolar membrane protein [Coprinopsis cinerea okayama7|uniref:Vacuolar membrane protein n=1 Tax=Coprinopsis cinerea (strain Okayama-7 / 130 / ATCC MYA-4618 / FGSC 9003) TaxID=240176 RepID=D6RJT0_COPC7|nr:vacuolar membrane protein [Coprinopsis cinerea okayama7\|eukprot:XP_002912131.1 vacuolar membrane protein [Coprinopsis cinerea okayama7\